jgi:cell division protein FtsB
MSPTIRRTLFAMLTAVVAVYAVVHLSGPNGVKALMEKRETIRTMQEENARLEEKVAAKTKYVEDIKAKKPEVIIPLIRNRTNWIREGERDFRIAPEPRHPAPAK